MMLSSNAIKEMGFNPIRADEPIKAAFHSLYVFTVHGLTLKDEGVVFTKASVANVTCTVAVGRSLNQINNSIFQNDYVEDEATWEKELKCTSPYAVILFGPTGLHCATDGHAKIDGNTIVTYDCFRAPQAELRKLEEKALPSIEIALTCAFSKQSNSVRFLFIERTAFGITPAKQTVYDIVITGTGEGYAPNPVTSEAIHSVIKQVNKLANLVHPRVAKFFQLGLRDEVDLTRFLYFFLAIEIDVRKCFKKNSNAQQTAKGATFSTRVSLSFDQLIVEGDNWRALAYQFVWCVASVWEHLCEADVVEFKRLKKIRDDIAHGNISAPRQSDVVAVEMLARKIHSPP